MNTCRCPETMHYVPYPNGSLRQVIPPEHSCQYVHQRNALIPQASRLAGAEGISFADAMDRLSREAKARGEM